MKEQHPRTAAAVVVNDDTIQLTMLSTLVREAGLEPAAFRDVDSALAYMAAGPPPALVITDLYMPDIDGWKFCRLLRSPEYRAFNQVPILVVSATWAGEEAERITADLGADAFLPAPVDSSTFAAQINAILQDTHTRLPARVLIVQDSEAHCSLLEKTFSAEGYRADMAFSVQEAAAAIPGAAYSTAVIDYHLPDGTGDILLAQLRAEQPDCACIMMTADSNPELALKWMKQGAAAFLRKPFEPAYLLELCSRTRRERALFRTERLLETRTVELNQSEEALRLQHNLSLELSVCTELNQALDSILDTLLQIDGVDCGGVYLSSKKSGDLNLAVSRGLSADFAAHVGHCAAESSQVRTLAAGKTIYVHYDRIRSEDDGTKKSEGLRAVIIIPVCHQGQLIAALNLASHEHDTFPEKSRAALETLALQTGSTLARIHSQEQLRISEEIISSMLESLPVGVIRTKPDGQIVFANRAMAEMHGYSDTAEFVRKNAADNYAVPEERTALAEQLESKGLVKNKEMLLRRKDGSVFHGCITARAPRNADGTAIYFDASVVDITDRKKAETELNHSHNLMRYIIEHANSAVAVHDRELRYIYVSKRYLEQYRVSESDVIGRHHYDVFPDLPEKWRLIHTKALKGEISRADCDPYYRQDGTMDWTRWECRPWYEADGTIGGIIVYTEVITDQVRTEKELAESVAELKQFNKFMVGRELRMAALKEEINALRKIRNEPPKYPSLPAEG